jgi:hypothetical protein
MDTLLGVWVLARRRPWARGVDQGLHAAGPRYSS